MNAYTNQDELTTEYKVDFRAAKSRTSQAAPEKNRPSSRRGKGPVQFNGIHRRRTKKIRW